MGYPVYDVAVGQIVYRCCRPTVVGVVVKVKPQANSSYFKDVHVKWLQKCMGEPAGTILIHDSAELANFERLAEDTMKKAKNHMKRLKDAQKAAKEL